MLGRSRATLAVPPVAVVPVQVWGPEPIGAATAEAIQGQYGAAMAGASGQLAGWGLNGQQETVSQGVYAPPQDFTGGLGSIAAQGHLVAYPHTALPDTWMPPALQPYGLG
jgi:hypothetical protein